VLTYSHRDLQLLQLAALTSGHLSVYIGLTSTACCITHLLTHSVCLSVCLVVGQYHKIAAKRKHVGLDIDLNANMQILKKVDSNAKQKDTACKLGINVSTVSKLIKNCEKIEKDFHSLLTSAGCKRMR